MRSRNVVVASVVAVLVATALFGTVAYGIYAGINLHRTPAATQGAIVTGSVPASVGAPAAATALSDSAPVNGSASSSSAIAQPAPGTFLPGAPYGDSGVGADGISAWGVAYREVTDPNAQPDTALIKAAYQDAEKKVADLGTATGVKVGKLVAISDRGINQPFYKPCIQSGPPLGKPVPGAASGSGSGSGSTGSGTAIQPAPAPAPCAVNNSSYLVVWVFVRHAIG